MGLKSGSRDAGLDDADDTTTGDESHHDATTDPEVTTATEQSSVTPSASTPTAASQSTSQASAESVSHRPTVESLPYTLRRDKVNDGREQVPYFLRPEVIDAEDDLHDTLEELLGETVYKSDYREASMVVAQRHPELVADVLREWGYDLDTR